jgi:hypothetical protein
MENRIQINGVWYVAEQTQVQPEVKNVNWLIKKLQELADAGCGEYVVTADVDYGNDYAPIESIELLEWNGNNREWYGNYRVHIL